MKIIARDRKGVEHIIEVMEALRDAGLPVAAECGGACACATCHVYVEDGWYEKLMPPSPRRARHARHGRNWPLLPDPGERKDR